MESRFIRFAYGSAFGRACFKLLLRAGLPKLMAAYLNAPLSRRMIPRFIKKNQISMDEYPQKTYASYGDFFTRERPPFSPDPNPGHFISPCDGYFSSFPITEDASFAIKGSHYRLCDLVDDATLAARYRGGLCLIFRLCAADYHHYSFVDDGYIHENHFIEGQLHSVQPIACAAVPVYRLNRRAWALLDTAHFGSIVQIEVGAMAVGGIVNAVEKAPFTKGAPMGHFSLCGSTIVLLVERSRLTLTPDARERRVRQGQCIAQAVKEGALC